MENITTSTLPPYTMDDLLEISTGREYNGHRAMGGLHIFSIAVYAVAFLLGTTGNSLVIWIAGFKMKKTVNVVWFLNLAIADVIFTFLLPLSIAYIALGIHWPFGTFMCKLNSGITFLNMFASIFTLTIISIDRWIFVMFPVWAQNHRTPRMASIASLFIWLFALSFSLTYFIFRDTYEEDDGRIICFNNFDEEDDDLHDLRHRATVITRFVVGFFIPFTIIIVCNMLITLHLHRNRMAKSTKPFKVIVAVLLFFFFCWLPYHILSFLDLYANDNGDPFLHKVLDNGIPVAIGLAYLNSCVNPFLYVFIGRDFKTKFWTSSQAIFERAFREDLTQTDSRSKSKSTSDSQLL
ncbi:chemerin-like receptor 1 [Pelobates fuscus]|uniref:chemerin-like receptor 1 n=1 Tax=Pelobates fuscus TaxID=191477 RepID=UPI002FE47490